jgi:hypothetical protein
VDGPTYHTVSSLAKAAGCSQSLILVAVRRGRLRPDAYYKWSKDLQPLFSETRVADVLRLMFAYINGPVTDVDKRLARAAGTVVTFVPEASQPDRPSCSA